MPAERSTRPSWSDLSLLSSLGGLRGALSSSLSSGSRGTALDEFRGRLLLRVRLDLGLYAVQLTEQLSAEELAVRRQLGRRQGELGCQRVFFSFTCAQCWFC